MSRVGAVAYSSSSRSPISVSSLSSSSASVLTSSCDAVVVARHDNSAGTTAYRVSGSGAVAASARRTHVRGSSRREAGSHDYAAADVRHDGACILVYMTPALTRQFVSLSSAAAFLRQQQRPSSPCVDANQRETQDARLAGGYWRLGYVVGTPTAATGDDAVSPRFPCWCFTLEPLPAEELELCRSVLSLEPPTSPLRRFSGTPNEEAHRSHHHRRRHESPQHDCRRDDDDRTGRFPAPLHDLLVTPLYICTSSAAVVELNAAITCATLARALMELTHCAAGWAVDTLDTALQVLVQAVPCTATLAYALRHRHRFLLPLLPLVGQRSLGDVEEADSAWSSRNAAVDVYATVGSNASHWQSSSYSSAEKRGAADLLAPSSEEPEAPRALSQPWSAVVRNICARCPWTTQQSVIFHGDSATAMWLRRGAMETLALAALPTSPTLSAKLSAALQLLDTLTPAGVTRGPSTGAGPFAVVVNALLVDVQCVTLPAADTLDDGEPPVELRIVGGRVRRSVAVADAFVGGESTNSPFTSGLRPSTGARHIVPEPDVMALPWFSLVSHDAKSGEVPTKEPGVPSRVDSAQRSFSPLQVTPADVERWMCDLQFSEVLRTHVRDVTRAVQLLASLRFATRHGTTTNTEAALLTAASVSACEAASQLLGVPSLDLVQLLTSVEVGSDCSSSSEGNTVRHALNCAGACQLQSVLVAHLGGVVVGTLLQAINNALSSSGEPCGTGSREGGDTSSSVSVVSLIVTTGDEHPQGSVEERGTMEDCKDREREMDRGGLQDWYAFYTHTHIYSAVCARLLGALRYEARCEGVERELDTWIDGCDGSVAVDGSSRPHSCGGGHPAAEMAEVAKRVRLSDLPPCVSTLEQLADIIDTVAAQCGGDAMHACVSTVVEAQQLLQEALTEFVAEQMDCEKNVHDAESPVKHLPDDGGEPNSNEGRGCWRVASHCAHAWTAGDTILQWTASERPCRKGSDDSCMSPGVAPRRAEHLRLSSRAGLHRPVCLSLTRLAADIIACVRQFQIGSTAAVQRVVTTTALRSAALLRSDACSDSCDVMRSSGNDLKLLSDRDATRRRADSATEARQPPCSRQALLDTLALQSALHVGTASELPTRSSLTVVQAIPISAREHRDAAAVSRFPFLEPTASPLAPPETPLTLASSSLPPPATMDDVVSRHLRETQPLSLALFFWWRTCHTLVCPVVRFGKNWAAPLLLTTTYASRAPTLPRTPPSTPLTCSPSSLADALRLFSGPFLSEEAADISHRVRALRSQARYRELALLALTTVPICRSAVLGVSCVFLSVAAAQEMARCRSEVRKAAARCVQRAGRGWLARRTLSNGTRDGNKTSTAQAGVYSEDRGALAPRVLTPAELQKRAAFERQREDALRETASVRTNALHTSAVHMATAVSKLQQHWTTTLELLESELTGATNEINSLETQRRAAEDTSRQEARTRARVSEEAWAEVWAAVERRRQHQQTVQTVERQSRMRHRAAMPPSEVSTAAYLQEEERLAEIATRHVARLRRRAIQSSEAALLARVVAQTQRGDARRLRQHVKRQERRLQQEAEMREQLQQQQPSGQRAWHSLNQGRDVSVAQYHNTMTPARASCTTRGPSPLLQYSDARGLVFTRPRPISREAAQRRRAAQTAQPRPLSPEEAEGVRYRVSPATIDRTALSTSVRSALADDEDWEVQRDLMSLWESSRVTT
jgi:hypothetical protein